MTVGRADPVTIQRPPEAIIRGIRELDDVVGYRRLAEIAWHAGAEVWVLPFELKVSVPAEATTVTSVPEISVWVALLSAAYPHGKLEIYPAANGGIAETFPHQTVNNSPKQGQSWRQGKLCVVTPFATFGRTAYDAEPRDASSRLTYHIERARQWVEAARLDALLGDGEPFELPVYASEDTALSVAFDAGASDVVQWGGVARRAGLATLVAPPWNERLRILVSLGDSQSGSQDPHLPAPHWGAELGITRPRAQQETAAWVRLTSLPCVDPWRAPTTWGELVACVRAQGVDLLGCLKPLARHFRSGRPHLLLLGAPIPSRVGESPTVVHWLALKLPVLSHGKKVRPGFRGRESGYWLRDCREVLMPSTLLTWITTQNWAADEIATRGRAAPALRDAQVVLIGAGALGSALGEMLIREGVRHVVIIDHDILRAGNLVRHTLSMHDIGRKKAQALADRMNSLSPHAAVTAVASHFPGDERGTAALQTADLIIDCTADDEVVSELGRLTWGEPKRFLSCSVGLHAKRLFMYLAHEKAFPASDFANQVNPWIQRDREEFKGIEMPWEGIGCWHPVFPARASDFQLFAAVLVRRLDSFMQQANFPPLLTVLERHFGEDGTLNLQEAVLPPGQPDA